MTDFNYPETRAWLKEYAIRQFENAMARDPLINEIEWTIEVDTTSLFCGEKIDHERKIYTVLVLARQ